MTTLLIGSTGTVGSAVHTTLVERGHDVVTADFDSDDSPIDITDSASIAALYERVGQVDAVVSTVGVLQLSPLGDSTFDDVTVSIRGKLLSQIDIVLQGLPYVRSGGSFTLVSGIMSRIPWRGGIGAAVANGGLDAFVIALAAELTGDRRINAVSPSILRESIETVSAGVNPLPGHQPVDAAAVAGAFLRSVEGIETGKTFTVGF